MAEPGRSRADTGQRRAGNILVHAFIVCQSTGGDNWQPGRQYSARPAPVQHQRLRLPAVQHHERARLEFRAEAYNVTNTPWFDLPDTTLGDASFGQITTAQGNQAVKVNMSRSWQGSLRLTF